MNFFEYIDIQFNNILYIAGIDVFIFLLFMSTKYMNQYLYNKNDKREKMIRRTVLTVAIVIYMAFSIIWTLNVECIVEGDQIPVLETATALYHDNVEEVLQHDTYAGVSIGRYLETNQQQIPLACMYSVFLKIMHTDQAEMLRIINIISNVLIVLALYKITTQLAKDYPVNKAFMFTLILTFVSIPMLSTFIYGDIPSLALCLFSIYFMMKYTESKKWKYAILASFFMMIAYMMRMNNLIFIIATVIYLLLSIWKEFKQTDWKQKGFEIAIILAFIIISIFPSALVKNYYINKLGLDKTKTYPTISYFLMAMQEGPRGNGWYREETGEYALKNPEKAKEEYPDKIKERVTYLIENMGYTFQFYKEKIASMWAENTYSAVCSNISKPNDPIQNFSQPLEFYQKTVLLIITVCSVIVMIQNRKKLSLEVLFLITIFIGGFVFHILWEAKSRYIIPYIIVLMPVASIVIQRFKRKVNDNLDS